MSVEKPSDSDTNKDSHLLTEEEVKAQLEALTPDEIPTALTEEEVKAQLEALAPEESVPVLTEEEVKAQLESLKKSQ